MNSFYSSQTQPTDTFRIQNAGVFLNQGLNKDNKGAITDFSQALQINPNNAPAYPNRGIARRFTCCIDTSSKKFDLAQEWSIENNRSIVI